MASRTARRKKSAGAGCITGRLNRGWDRYPTSIVVQFQLYGFGFVDGELATASLDIDSPADADGTGDAGIVQYISEGLGALMGSGLPRIFLGWVERDHVYVANQPFEQ